MNQSDFEISESTTHSWSTKLFWPGITLVLIRNNWTIFFFFKAVFALLYWINDDVFPNPILHIDCLRILCFKAQAMTGPTMFSCSEVPDTILSGRRKLERIWWVLEYGTTMGFVVVTDVFQLSNILRSLDMRKKDEENYRSDQAGSWF